MVMSEAPTPVPPPVTDPRFPFRTYVRTMATVEVFADQGMGSRSPRNPEDLLDSINRGWTDSRAEMAHWLGCPDERVTIELIKYHSLLQPYEAQWLLERALAQADEENLIWTPVLDLFFISLELDTISHEPGTFGHIAAARLQPRLGKMRRWISRHGWRSALPLLAFQALDVHAAVVEYAPRLPTEWLVRICDEMPDLYLRFIALDPFSSRSDILVSAVAEKPALWASIDLSWAMELRGNRKLLSLSQCLAFERSLQEVSTTQQCALPRYGVKAIHDAVATSLDALPDGVVLTRADVQCLLTSADHRVREAGMGLCSRLRPAVD